MCSYEVAAALIMLEVTQPCCVDRVVETDWRTGSLGAHWESAERHTFDLTDCACQCLSGGWGEFSEKRPEI